VYASTTPCNSLCKSVPELSFLEPGTENPRLEKSILIPVTMNPEGSDLIRAFFMPDGFVWKGIFWYLVRLKNGRYYPSVFSRLFIIIF
jgi:hypothetical protein